MSILCDKEHTKTYPESNLSDYASSHFIKHLAFVNRSAVNDEDKRSVVRLLFPILHHEAIMKQWYELMIPQDLYSFIENCLTIDQISKPIRGWFEEKDGFDHLSPEDQLWAQKAAASAKELFKPLAIFFAGGGLKVLKCLKKSPFVLALLSVYEREWQPGGRQ